MKYLHYIGIFSLLVALSATKEKTEDVGTVIGIDLGTTYSW